MAIEYTLYISKNPISHNLALEILQAECPCKQTFPLQHGFYVEESYESCGFRFSIYNTPDWVWDITDMNHHDSIPTLNGEFIYSQNIGFRLDKFFELEFSLDKMLRVIINILYKNTDDAILVFNDSTRFYRCKGVFYINGDCVFGGGIKYEDYFNNYEILRQIS